MIVSGGQTGADRAALDFALENQIPHAGWCPRGRLAEDGPLDPRYRLQETPSRNYAQRTEWNVRDSDATVLFTIAPRITGGTGLALKCARRWKKPVLHLHPAGSKGELFATPAAQQLLAFLAEQNVRTLNVAGPRASQEDQIAAFVHQVLQEALDSSDGRC